jgi:protein-L-isoaspartate(D-aspartate) O-methyltransferase
MLQDIEMEVHYTRTMIRRDTLAPEVMRAMEKVPRPLFVEEQIRGYAYRNGPLPIGYGQTISQPYIVALMTDLAAVGEGDKVLEVGTGSGYQAAVLAEVGAQVYSLEIIPELAEAAAERLKDLGYGNVEVRSGDGNHGWPDQAPFDAIVVTAAAEHVPSALIGQLKVGGRLVIPVGPPYGHQELIVIEKDAQGEVSEWSALPVAFVPLTGGE